LLIVVQNKISRKEKKLNKKEEEKLKMKLK